VTADAKEILETGLRTLKIPRVDIVCAKLLEFADLLLAENQRTNLTGARDLKGLVREHFLDSLAPLALLDLRPPIVDVGSGAGFPGIPAAIAHPDKEFVLLEPRAKRAAFLESAAKRLGLENVSVVKSSALGPGAAPVLGKAGTVLMRAVAEPGAALALGLPLLRPGGRLVMYEGRAARPSAELRKVAKRGGADIEPRAVRVPSLEAVRHAWIVRKAKARIREATP
jgi:16S rRNA (guanine527-N7)-methyltransferase